MSREKKFSVGDRIVISDKSTFWAGKTGVVIDPAMSWEGETEGWIVRVEMDSPDNGDIRRFFESWLTYVDPAQQQLPVTRELLTKWMAIFEEVSDPFNNDAEDAAKIINEMLNPPVVRTYTVTIAGRVADIESALANLEANEETLTDKVAVDIQLTKEEAVQDDGK